jgi:hypothetical protein
MVLLVVIQLPYRAYEHRERIDHPRAACGYHRASILSSPAGRGLAAGASECLTVLDCRRVPAIPPTAVRGRAEYRTLLLISTLERVMAGLY